MTSSTPLPEQGGFNEKLDEILLSAVEMEFVGKDVKGGNYVPVIKPEAKAAIRTLIAEEIIGEDGKTVGHIRPNGNPSVDMTQWYYNELRAEQRLRLGDTNGTK